jgi:hypothetical protein
MTAAWTAAFLLLSLVVLVDTVLILGLLRRGTAVLEQAERRITDSGSGSAPRIGVQPGDLVPAFTVLDRAGARIRSEELLGRDVIVMFMSAHCAPCSALAELLVETSIGHRTVPLVILVDDGGTPDMLGLGTEFEIYVDSREEAQRAFENIATPQAFLVEPSGVVSRRRVPSTVSDLESLGWRKRTEVTSTQTVG